MSRSAKMPVSKEFEPGRKDTPKEAKGKDTPTRQPLQRLPRVGAYIFTDGTAYRYDRPGQPVQTFDTVAKARKHEEQDRKKNPLNWKENLLTR